MKITSLDSVLMKEKYISTVEMNSYCLKLCYTF